MDNSTQFIDGPHGRIAYRKRAAPENTSKPGVVWLGGFRSDMIGTKAEFLDGWAARNNASFLRFDYSGHGESDGAFEDGCIGEWASDAFAAFEALTTGPQILVGSSMGAWIATLLALKYPDRIASIVFIAPAPDFTETLMWPSLSKDQQQEILTKGKIELPSEHYENELITRKLIEDGRNNLVMTNPIPFGFPVRILQGQKDDAVPFEHALAFAKHIKSDDILINLSKSGDHRLSTPEDLERLAATIEALI